jgi:hypothetical protein
MAKRPLCFVLMRFGKKTVKRAVELVNWGHRGMRTSADRGGSTLGGCSKLVLFRDIGVKTLFCSCYTER